MAKFIAVELHSCAGYQAFEDYRSDSFFFDFSGGPRGSGTYVIERVNIKQDADALYNSKRARGEKLRSIMFDGAKNMYFDFSDSELYRLHGDPVDSQGKKAHKELDKEMSKALAPGWSDGLAVATVDAPAKLQFGNPPTGTGIITSEGLRYEGTVYVRNHSKDNIVAIYQRAGGDPSWMRDEGSTYYFDLSKCELTVQPEIDDYQEAAIKNYYDYDQCELLGYLEGVNYYLFKKFSGQGWQDVVAVDPSLVKVEEGLDASSYALCSTVEGNTWFVPLSKGTGGLALQDWLIKIELPAGTKCGEYDWVTFRYGASVLRGQLILPDTWAAIASNAVSSEQDAVELVVVGVKDSGESFIVWVNYPGYCEVGEEAKINQVEKSDG